MTESAETVEFWRRRAKGAELILAAIIGTGVQRVSRRAIAHYDRANIELVSTQDMATDEMCFTVRISR